MEMQYRNNGKVETTQIGLASYLHALGHEVSVVPLDDRQCIFVCDSCPAEIKEYQAGKAMVNAIVYQTSYRALLQRVKGVLREHVDRL